jgi:hypothetical protein
MLVVFRGVAEVVVVFMPTLPLRPLVKAVDTSKIVRTRD